MTFQTEPFDEKFIRDVEPLAVKHWKECGSGPFGPWWDGYKRAQELGILKVFTARDVEKLVGYQIFVLQVNFHNQVMSAYSDLIFVEKEYRGATGYRFIEFADKEVRGMGAKEIKRVVNTGLNVGELLKKMGYIEVSTIYGRK